MITLTRERALARPVVTGNPVFEQYHALVQWIHSSDETSALKSKAIGITSCARGAGVSTVAADLAIVAAQTCDNPVLLLDLSGARPSLATRLGMSEDLGLRRALVADSSPGECAVRSPISNLLLLAANETVAPESFGADVRKVNDLVRELKHDFELIVVDLPRVESGLCFAVAGTLDGVVLVVEAQRTDGAVAVRATRRLTHANAVVLGVILNKC
jgi:tyrosine-protein kinase Etk/Wzc